MSNLTTRTAYRPPTVTMMTVTDLKNTAELHRHENGDVELLLSPKGARPQALVGILRWAADLLEQPSASSSPGRVVRRPLHLVPSTGTGAR